jgi:hypothetical protein
MNARSNKSSQSLPKPGSSGEVFDPRNLHAAAWNVNPDAASSASSLTGVGRMISEICDINFAAWVRESRE